MRRALDDKVDRLVSANKHLLVPWYLILSYAYYYRDASLVSDELYDRICKDLSAAIDAYEIEHRHMRLCNQDALAAGTAYHIPRADYPSMAVSCADQFIREGYGT